MNRTKVNRFLANMLATSLLACSEFIMPRDSGSDGFDTYDAMHVSDGTSTSDGDRLAPVDVGPQSLNLQVVHTRPLAPIECRSCPFRMTNSVGEVREGMLSDRGRLDVVVSFSSPWDITIAIPTVGAISILGIDAPFDRPVFFANNSFWSFPPILTPVTTHTIRYVGASLPNGFVGLFAQDSFGSGFQGPDGIESTIEIDARQNMLLDVFLRQVSVPPLREVSYHTGLVSRIGPAQWEVRQGPAIPIVETEQAWPLAARGVFSRVARSGVTQELGGGQLLHRWSSALNPEFNRWMGFCVLEGDPLRPVMHCQRAAGAGEADRAEFRAFPDSVTGELYVTQRQPFSTALPTMPVVEGSVWNFGEQVRFGAQFEGDLYAGFHFTRPGTRGARNEFNWMGFAFRPGFREELRVMPRLPTGVRYADIGYSQPGNQAEILVTMTQGTPGVPPWDVRFRLDHETIRAYGRAYLVNNIDQ